MTLYGVMAVTLRYLFRTRSSLYFLCGKHCDIWAYVLRRRASTCGGAGIYAHVYCILSYVYVYDVVVKKVHVRYLISYELFVWHT